MPYINIEVSADVYGVIKTQALLNGQSARAYCRLAIERSLPAANEITPLMAIKAQISECIRLENFYLDLPDGHPERIKYNEANTKKLELREKLKLLTTKQHNF